jgi:pSer/pThr/pTyr-binding forkhead associated (FHA) protein
MIDLTLPKRRQEYLVFHHYTLGTFVMARLSLESKQRRRLALSRPSTWAALAGGMGGLVGHLGASIILDPFVNLGLHSRGLGETLLSTALMLAIIGSILSSVILAFDNHRTLRGRWRRDLLKGLPLFACLGFLTGGIAQLVYAALVVVQMLAFSSSSIALTRAVPWTIMGLSVGAGVGIVRRDSIQALRGALGGAIGGLLGGIIVDLLLLLSFTDATFALATLIGMIITGAMIAVFMRVVQNVLKKAWLVGISSGPYEGKEYSLSKNRITVGRSERNDLSLYRVPDLPMQLGVLVHSNEIWLWQGQVIEVNGEPKTNTILKSGDTIKLGGTQFIFETRATEQQVSQSGEPQYSFPSKIHEQVASTRPVYKLAGMQSHPVWILVGSNGEIRMPPVPASIQIGRSEQNQIILLDDSVSSHHALLEVDLGALKITDLNSKNGTLVNGVCIPTKCATPLNVGDRVTLGRQEYTVQKI